MRKIFARIKMNCEKINCEKCKCHTVDTLEDGTSVDYCYPRDFKLLAASCENRKKKHPEQCLYLNDKISHDKMLKYGLKS